MCTQLVEGWANMTLYAHTGTDGSLKDGQLLVDHLTNVADMAATFASPIGASAWARCAGRLHDAGKASDSFQRRLAGSTEKVGHAASGAKLAVELYGNAVGRMLALPILGHHGGMPNWSLPGERTPAVIRLNEPVEPFRDAYEGLLDLPSANDLVDVSARPNFLTRVDVTCQDEQLFGAYLTEQMLYSSLVDADYLDTERAMSPDSSALRDRRECSMAELAERLDAELERRFAGKETTEVNRIRGEVLRQCTASADSDPGLFTLEVPTGGGKTLSVMSFALHHAARNGQSRVIVAIPFTSIVEQTAAVLKSIFGEANVLEHHSNYDFSKSDRLDDDGVDPDGIRERLLVQNWDAPIVVTTNVQLFESLFSNTPSRCRKNHNVMNAVVVLDEAQTLPDDLLKPTLAMMQSLSDYASTTFVLCTATQPELDEAWPFPSRPRPLVDDRDGELYAPLESRVAYDTAWVEGDGCSLEDIVETMASVDQCLCVVSTRGAARTVYDRLKGKLGIDDGPDGGVFHLSARMIPEHRSRVIDEVRDRLRLGRPCRVVSTQLIEAGVDVDFPLVLREVAGIDSIIQAGGRCNREGRLEQGRVIVFSCPEIQGPPRGYLAAMRADGLYVIGDARRRGYDPFGSRGVKKFFETRYGEGQLDREKIYDDIIKHGAHAEFSFESYAQKYRFIEDDGVSVIVPWGERGEELLDRIESGEISSGLRRALQRYAVSVPRWAVAKSYEGCIRVMGPLYVLETRLGSSSLYSDEVGLVSADEGELDALVF